jgi:hypothetical protein
LAYAAGGGVWSVSLPAGYRERDRAGITPKMPIMGSMDGKQTASDVKAKLEILAIPMKNVEFSATEYDRLFPRGKVKTPSGIVKMGVDQFNKMRRKGRKNLLWAMRETLANPIVILPENSDGREAKLFIKSFTSDIENKKTFIMSVVVKSEGEDTAISTGPRKKKQIYRKLENASGFLYLLADSPAETGSAQAGLIGTTDTGDRTQQNLLSPSSSEKSREKNVH